MTSDMTQDTIRQLDALVEEERKALISGDLRALEPLLQRKERLIDALNAIELGHPPELEALKVKATRNQIMLDGALQGIRNVAARMAAVRKIRRTLETYDENGRKHTIEGEVERKVEKRA